MAKTTMSLERTTEGDLLFSGSVSVYDFALLKLDNFDRALLADCEREGRSAADWLLGLETIFRRMKEQGIAGVAPTDTPGCTYPHCSGEKPEDGECCGDATPCKAHHLIACAECAFGVKEVLRGS